MSCNDSIKLLEYMWFASHAISDAVTVLACHVISDAVTVLACHVISDAVTVLAKFVRVAKFSICFVLCDILVEVVECKILFLMNSV